MNRPIISSAQACRTAIPLMTRHGFDYSPMSYAVWYEYAKCNDSVLTAELKPSIDRDERVSEDLTKQLYRHHIAETIDKAFWKSRKQILELTRRTDESVQNASASAATFDSSLREFSSGLSTEKSADELKAHVSSMQDEVGTIGAALHSLKRTLETNQLEMQRLASELAEAKRDANKDSLTGCLNRRGFDDALAEAMLHTDNATAANDKQLTLVMVDIDHFKLVNDEHGHVFGDRVIQMVAKQLERGVTQANTVSRYGGEEFALILPATADLRGQAIADRIRLATGKSALKADNAGSATVNVTISAGVAQYRAGDSQEALVARADQALYEAKKAGRNQVSTAQ